MEQLKLFKGDYTIEERAVRLAEACIKYGHNSFTIRGFDWTVEHIKSLIKIKGVYFKVHKGSGYILQLGNDATEDIL